MSPLDLPGAPLPSSSSKKTVKCPRCNTVNRGGKIENALKDRASKDVEIKCYHCGYIIKLKKKQQKT